MNIGNLITEIATVAQIATTNPDTTLIDNKPIEINKQKIEQIKSDIIIDPKETANPWNINLETRINENIDYPIGFQRVHIHNKKTSFKYDHNQNQNDVLQIAINLPKNFGIAFYNSGDWNKQNMFYFEASKKINFGDNIDLNINAMGGKGKNQESELFTSANLKTNNLFAIVALYDVISDLGKLNQSIYGGLGYDFNKSYLGLGKNQNRFMATTGVKGLDDFGAMSLFLYDVKSNNWSFVTQAALNNINQSFFHEDLFDFITGYFSLPNFFPKHFTPQTNKGDYSIKFNGRGEPRTREIEGKLGYYNEIIPFSFGINSLNKNGIKEHGLVVEINKLLKFSNGLKIHAEAKYNFRDNSFGAYFIFK